MRPWGHNRRRMNPENIKNLADAVKDYFSQYELEDSCRRFGIVLNYSGTSPNLRRLAGDILSNPDTDQNGNSSIP